MSDENLKISSHVRKHCEECSGESTAARVWCGVFGCNLWPFRFGIQPATFRRKYGGRLLTPGLMPLDNVPVESLPSSVLHAATSAIDVEGYRQPQVVIEPEVVSEEERARRRATGERLKASRDYPQEIAASV